MAISQRDRRVLKLTGIVVPIVLVVIGAVYMRIRIVSETKSNASLAAAITNVEDARGRLQEARQKKQAVLQRYQNKAPSLSSYLDEQARAEKLDVMDHNDRAEVKIGKRYVERHHVMHLKKSGMLGIAKFMERIASSQHPLAFTRLNIRKRSGEQDLYDVELGVSAYDRAEASSSAAGPGKADGGAP